MDSRIIHLFQNYLNEQCTADELQEVFAVLKNGTHQEEWKTVISDDAERIMMGNQQTDLNEMEADQLYARIENTLQERNSVVSQQQLRKPAPSWFKYGIAAAILVVCGFGAYFYRQYQQKMDLQLRYAHDIAPGSNQASLTLADGTRISLTDVKNGKLAEQAGVKISKTADGQLTYKILDQSGNKEISYNTVATPKGGQYQIKLPDGTSVWLNAAATLKFPVTFSNAKERKVQLTGEAYFEVAKDKDHPFIVSTDRQEVQVLGTHFLVNGYDDEPFTKTVLMEGAVQVSPMGPNQSLDFSHTIKLKPGQQAILQRGTLEVAAVDIEEAMAWKNGYFRFNDESLESIMRKLARWYDIEVNFKGYKSDGGFTGAISRNKSIKQVLMMLEKTKDIHFKIEGRRITVMP